MIVVETSRISNKIRIKAITMTTIRITIIKAKISKTITKMMVEIVAAAAITIIMMMVVIADLVTVMIAAAVAVAEVKIS